MTVVDGDNLEDRVFENGGLKKEREIVYKPQKVSKGIRVGCNADREEITIKG
jgi:hypothetical protein